MYQIHFPVIEPGIGVGKITTMKHFLILSVLCFIVGTYSVYRKHKEMKLEASRPAIDYEIKLVPMDRATVYIGRWPEYTDSITCKLDDIDSVLWSTVQ